MSATPAAPMLSAAPEMVSPFRHIITGSVLDRRRNWYVFRVFNLYRLTVAALLLTIFSLESGTRFFGTENPTLFFWAAAGYVAIVLGSIGLSFLRRPSLRVQAQLQAVVDIVCLTLLMRASGGLGSNVSVLLVVAVAASSIMLPLISALFTGALAFFVVTGQWLQAGWTRFQMEQFSSGITDLAAYLAYMSKNGDELARLGVLGASLLIAALLTYTLAERSRRSEDIARQRTQELLEVAELNQTIVQHLQSGVIVVDRLARVRLMNDTARELLSFQGPCVGLPLSEISSQLSQRLATWLSAGIQHPKPFRQDEHLPDVTPSFTHLSGNLAFDTLIFLEDSGAVAQRLQQIKLAALGRLTAGIAHEIRNPLASISHAAQLLGESPSASPSDRRLGQIIQDNAKRANRIIANVLDMSKRDKIRPEDFAFKPWLDEFCKEFLRAHGEPRPKLELKVNPSDLWVRFDPSQLHQILWNLFTNAVLHGTPSDQAPRIRVQATLDPLRQRPMLDIMDFGNGIPDAESKKIFEPFFTTKAKGTGLGLFIAREMCEANRAQLQYMRSPDGGSCFRITFAQQGRQQTKEAKWSYETP